MPKDIFKKDPYSILGVAGDATDKEIYSVYRKKALKCHPDKNPDNPKAAELFHELSKALEILTNVAARAAYDQTIKAKRASEERNKVLDSKRKKFKEDLEARERAFQERKQTQKREAAEKKYRQQEKERLEASSRPEKQDWQRYHQQIELHRLCVEERRLREEERRQRELARQVEVAQWKAQNEGYTMDTLNKSGSEYTESAAEIDRDFETLVLMKMRQAEERNRLIIE